MSIHSFADQVHASTELHSTPFIVDAMRAAERFADTVDRFGGDSTTSLLEAIDDDTDTVAGIAAIHALARVFDDSADVALSNLLSDPREFVREHSAWAMAERLPRLDAIARLVGVVFAGGFAGMLAQSTLQQWAATTPDHVALALEGALVGSARGGVTAGPAAEAPGAADEARARLAETLGLMPGRVAGRMLVSLVTDETEALAVRCAAMAALGDRNAENAALRTVQRYVDEPGLLGDAARLAAYDIELTLNPAPRQMPMPRATDRGLTVAQLFLHADIDRELTKSGAGDNGGIATLLVRLGDALATVSGIERVVTLSRGSAAEALAALAPDRANTEHVFAPVPLLGAPQPTARAWPARVSAERGIRRALLALGPVDALHLRMADVGSLAAATVAERLGITVVFTLAPDPHAVIHALDMAGSLTRRSFGEVDAREHFWFRARLVSRLAAQAEQRVLFPRPDLAGDLEGLLGIDITRDPSRYTVVPEGIDVSVVAAALAEADPGATNEADPGATNDMQRATPRESGPLGTIDAPGAPRVPPPPAVLGPLDAFDALLGALPPERRGLPVAISVGRLHPVKGMATIVEAWAADPALRETCNLLIVGGDLSTPSGDERAQLDLIEAVLAEHPLARSGLLLAGHRPNDVVARWLAAVRFGRPGLSAAGGIYVCGSVKEEFGIALLEALATGLVVIAPDGGGPATYVADGVTGFLVDTRTPAGLRRGMHDAFALAAVNPLLERADDDGRVAQAQNLVRSRFTIGAMASALADVYRAAARAQAIQTQTQARQTQARQTQRQAQQTQTPQTRGTTS